MKNLDRDAVSRSLDYQHMLEKQRESEFSEWDDLKYGLGLPLLFILLIASVIGLFVSLWGSLR